MDILRRSNFTVSSTSVIRMDCVLRRSARPVCFWCRTSALLHKDPQWPHTTFLAPLQTRRPRDREQRRHASVRAPDQLPGKREIQKPVTTQQKTRRLSSQESDRIQNLADRVLQHPQIPSENETQNALDAIGHTAKHLMGVGEEAEPPKRKSKPHQPHDTSPASTLLSLDSKPVPNEYKPASENIDFLSYLAYNLLTNDRVFITPQLLTSYIHTQTLLQRPHSFSEIFHLYAHKPSPEITKSRTQARNELITHRPAKPTAISTAIPIPLANLALLSALQTRNNRSSSSNNPSSQDPHALNLALEIIQTTFRAPSFRRAKFFRSALPPLTLASLAPVAAYTLASNISALQTALPSEDFTTFAFAGLITYLTAVSSIGYVALTTRNDQMERVTWVVGMPLWERWAREEERAAVDGVVRAWGFKERWRWGEEGGREWVALREWCGVRGMVVDKVGLMEGME